MKTIILTGKFGLGHVKAAEAIKEELLRNDPQNKVEIIDFVTYMFPNFEKIIYKGFNLMVSKCSSLYNMLNVLASEYTSVPMKRNITAKMERMIATHQPDQLIITFPVCPQYVSRYKLTTGNQIPMYTVITDITAHESWIAKGTNHYFVGADTTKESLILKGVPEEKITVSGIPVHQKFYRSERKPVKNQKEVLIMGGGLGLLSKEDRILKGLASRKDVHVTVITGNNHKLRQSLSEAYPQMDIVGFTNQVENYMDKADVIVTKAGGITTFEAIASNTPLYVVRPFLEQELGNARFIEEQNIGRVLWDTEMHTDEWEDFSTLLENPDLLTTMQVNMINLKEKRGISASFLFT